MSKYIDNLKREMEDKVCMMSGVISMDYVNELHKLFSKATMAIDSRGISAMYSNEALQNVFSTLGPSPYDEEWRSRLLRELLSRSEAFDVVLKPDELSALRFSIDGISNDTVLYPPIERQLTVEELRSITEEACANKPLSEEGEKFLSFFVGADLSDEDEVFAYLNEWWESVDSTAEEIVGFSSTVRFRKMRDIAKGLINRGFVGVEIEEPSGWSEFAGGISINFDSETVKRRFSGKDKESIIGLLELSGCFEIEVCTLGSLTMVFFA